MVILLSIRSLCLWCSFLAVSTVCIATFASTNCEAFLISSTKTGLRQRAAAPSLPLPGWRSLPYPDDRVTTGSRISWDSDGFCRQKVPVVIRLASSEDDGWDDDDNGVGSEAAEKRALLQSLQDDRKQQSLTGLEVSRDSGPTGRQSEEPERDLFIPIFALVSLAGLFGAYGYEMLRLASRGELYLPWNNILL